MSEGKWGDLAAPNYSGMRIRVTDRDNQIFISENGLLVPEIIWTNCADVMPGLGYGIEVILRQMSTKEPVVMSVHQLHLVLPEGNPVVEWPPYAPEKWKELNK